MNPYFPFIFTFAKPSENLCASSNEHGITTIPVLLIKPCRPFIFISANPSEKAFAQSKAYCIAILPTLSMKPHFSPGKSLLDFHNHFSVTIVNACP